jgi:hypothetical protein
MDINNTITNIPEVTPVLPVQCCRSSAGSP